MTQRDNKKEIQEAAQKAAQRTREISQQGKDLLTQYAPFSYIALVGVSLFVLLVAGGLHNQWALFFGFAYIVWWIAVTIFQGLALLRVNWNEGTLSKTSSVWSYMIKRQLPVWLVAYCLVIFDAITGTYLASNPISFIVFNAVGWYMVRRQERLKSVDKTLRKSRANVQSDTAPVMPQNAYSDVIDDGEPVPVQPAVMPTVDPYAAIEEKD